MEEEKSPYHIQNYTEKLSKNKWLKMGLLGLVFEIGIGLAVFLFEKIILSLTFYRGDVTFYNTANIFFECFLVGCYLQGFYFLALMAVRPQPFRLRMFFAPVFQNAKTYFLLALLHSIIGGMFVIIFSIFIYYFALTPLVSIILLIVFLVVGIVVLLDIELFYFFLADHPDMSIIASIKASCRIMRGNKKKALGIIVHFLYKLFGIFVIYIISMYVFSFLPKESLISLCWYILCAMLAFYFAPYTACIYASFYLELTGELKQIEDHLKQTECTPAVSSESQINEEQPPLT